MAATDPSSRGGNMALSGTAHVALTVTDLSRSKEWYARVLDWKSVMEGEHDTVRFSVGIIPDGVMVGLREYDGVERRAFDPQQVGLDHLAFGVGSRAELDGWESRFDELGVTYTPTQSEEYGSVLNFKDPDGIALEIFAELGT
jgi:catechol 2,3-dioxygenase-like lactoylglutathione lyase family enzyme